MEVKTIDSKISPKIAADFAKNLSAVMQNRGITAYRLSQITGLSKSQLYRLLDAEAANDPTISTVKRLCKALKCNSEALLGV
jgi:DNA-binding Xre family transcriptional regulator